MLFNIFLAFHDGFGDEFLSTSLDAYAVVEAEAQVSMSHTKTIRTQSLIVTIG